MTMDLYTSALDKKKVDDMKLLEDTIGLEKTNSSSATKKIIQFGAWKMGYYIKYLVYKISKSTEKSKIQ